MYPKNHPSEAEQKVNKRRKRLFIGSRVIHGEVYLPIHSVDVYGKGKSR